MDESSAALLPFLAWAMEDRGTTSWGVSNGREIRKELGPISRGWAEVTKAAEDWWGQPMMVHTRAPSVGAAKKENAHPWAFEKGTGRLVEASPEAIIGCHNGTLANHRELGRKFSLDFEVDSQYIFALLASGKDTREIEGGGTLLWFEDGVLRCLRFNHTALSVALLENGTCVMCSEEEAILRACRMTGVKYRHFYQLNQEVEYLLRQDEGAFVGRKIEFGDERNYYYRSGSSSSSGYVSNYYTRSTGDSRWTTEESCWMCQCILHGTMPGLLCDGCYETLLMRMGNKVREEKARVIRHDRAKVIHGEKGKARGHHR